VVNTLRVRVLVFSNSDVVGSFIGGEGWGTMLAQSDPLALQVTTAAFFPGAPTAAAYAAKRVAELKPELVVLPVGGYGFTNGYVEFRVKRLLGRRAAAGYKAVEQWFDRKTRTEGEAPRGLNAFARMVSRHTIGTEPQTSQAEITGYVCRTLDALAQFEHTTTILVTWYPGLGRNAEPKVLRNRRRFFKEISDRAKLHRFPVLAVDQMLEHHGRAEQFVIDDIHFNTAGHRLIAAAIREAIDREMVTG
jgi:hypothetical protein